MGIDKRNSGRKKIRISERFLLLSAFFMGAMGIWAGMYAFRHKTQKWSFLLAVPLLLILNMLVLYYFLEPDLSIFS